MLSLRRPAAMQALVGRRMHACTEAAKESLRENGYAVLRLGAVTPLQERERVARELMGDTEAVSYNKAGGSVKRKTIGDSGWLDTAEGAPPQIRIQFHHELAYARSFPKYVSFGMMVQNTTSGGLTEVVDSVKMTAELSPAMRAKMQSLGVVYVRLLSDESERGKPGFFTSWQQALQTECIDEALARGNSADSILGWHTDGKRLRHLSWAPVFHTHPSLGELHFGAILSRHASWHDGDAKFDYLPHGDRPYHCLWGDGSELSDAEIAELRSLHDRNMEQHRLEVGDIIVLDNLRVMHGREPYAGKRQLGLLISSAMVDREPSRQPPPAFAALREA
jgi:alpha-ketoglutarate-dependent taurine dioxygenase